MRVLIPILVLIFAGSAFAQQGWRLETLATQWDERGYHSAVTFNSELWVLQGSAGVSGYRHDAWSSSDGVNWNEEVAQLPWVITIDATTVVFNGQMWVLGGDQGGNFANDVWRSPDGVNWTQEPDAPWLERKHSAGVVFNGKMWILGGWTKQPTYQAMLNDVWSTTDGVNWTQEVAAAAWSTRNEHTVAVFNNRMWFMGGGGGGQVWNDVWSSADGVNWVQETANAPWGPRMGHRTVVYRDRLWVIGGLYADPQAQWNNFYYDDMWSSADGVNWVKESDSAPWGEGERKAQAITVFNNRIWLTGGADRNVGYRNDVWSYGLHIAPDDQPQFVTNVDEPFSQTFEARVGDGPFDWTLLSGQMPAGMTLDTNTTSDTIQLAGTPTEKGLYHFTLQLEDNDGNIIEQDYNLTVISPPPPSGSNGSNSGCTARSAGPARPCSLPWLILTTAATLAAILRRRDAGAGICEQNSR